MTDAQLTLTVNGRAYSSWLSVDVSQSMDSLVGSFSLSVAQALDGSRALDLYSNQLCTVAIGSNPIITGYITAPGADYSGTSHSAQLVGDDRTADLIDCSAEPGEYNGQTLLQLAQRLCSPFGIAASADVDVGSAMPAVAVEPGETVFEVLDRAARQRGLLLISDGAGGLRITRASTARLPITLERGVNILAASGRRYERNRYSKITVLGQAPDTEWVNGSRASAATGSAIDHGIGRYRPLIMLAESSADLGGATGRADYEVRTRRAQALQLTITVAGWSHPGGLWQINKQVRVVDTWMLASATDLLIVGVRYLYDEGGARTELRLSHRDAYDIKPLSAATDLLGVPG